MNRFCFVLFWPQNKTANQCFCLLYLVFRRPAAAQNRRSQAVANRILRNTLQQPMRERRQQAQRGARQRARGSGISGQVRMLTNSIEKLQAQVASLQQTGISTSSYRSSAGQRGRGSVRGNRGSARGGGRFNHNNNTYQVIRHLCT